MSKYQKANSRQLKGYLTLFDQVLANQFSQLSNVHNLFSFKNSVTGTPSDRIALYSSIDKLSKIDNSYFTKDKNTFDPPIADEIYTYHKGAKLN